MIYSAGVLGRGFEDSACRDKGFDLSFIPGLSPVITNLELVRVTV